jgi:transposase
MGVGHHKRKNDAMDAEVAARAVDEGRIPVAHILSPERRSLRAQLSVRGALVETRAQYITTIRGLGRAAGVLLPSCATPNFANTVRDSSLDEATRTLIAPLLSVLDSIETQLREVEAMLSEMASREPIIQLLAMCPGVGLIVASTFVSVIDEAKRFRNAQALGAYLGLVPAELTTGGPDKRRLGSITKQGNAHARRMLVQSAWLILRSRDFDDPIRQWGDRIAKTRGKRIAVTVVARKLAGVLWAMWRDGTEGDDQEQEDRACQDGKVQAIHTSRPPLAERFSVPSSRAQVQRIRQPAADGKAMSGSPHEELRRALIRRALFRRRNGARTQPETLLVAASTRAFVSTVVGRRY